MTDKSENANSLDLGADRYRFLVEESGDMISTHRPGDWAYTSVNPAVKAIAGYDPEELMGKPAYDFFHPEDAEAMKRKLIPAIYRHGRRTFRYRHRHKNGRYGWVESTHRSIRDEETGELKEIITVTRDITPQVQAELAYKRLADVLEVSSDLVVFCDRDFRVTYMNTSAQLGFGLASETEGQKFSALVNLESFQKIKTLACQLAERRGRWQGYIRLKSPRFEQRQMALQEVLVHPQAIGAHTDDYYSLMIRDVTEQLRAEQVARQHQAEIAHASRLMTMGEMASGIAHEINQPLATTLNYARGANRQIESGKLQLASELKPVFDKIVRQAERAAEIVKRLRGLVKKTPYQRQEFGINAVCEEVAAFLSHDLNAREIEVEFKLDKSDPVIDADPVQIEQVLINLLRNAMDAYVGLDRDEKRIRLQTQVDDGHLWIRVTDFGKGIDRALYPRLFEPYVSAKTDGLGMGLSISRTIVEAHGGLIEVDSDGKSYTCFQVKLPLNR